ncbi:T9SS type A sorting domain-containing protein [bacterium]|nr:T9SS type A sorting domain-containing protein [bacterium]
MQKTSDHKKLESVSYAENSCTNSRLPKHYSCLVPRLRGDDEVRHLPLLIMKLSTSIPIVFLLLSTLIFLALPTTTHAQWVEGGLMITHERSGRSMQMFPIEDGGFWLVYEDPNGDIIPKTWVQQFDSAGYAQFPERGIPVVPDSVLYWNMTDMFGAVQRPDGGVTVCFAAHIDRDYDMSIYAQAISLDGEYLFGPSGAVVSERPHIQWIPSFGKWPLAKPDESGGFWVYYENPERDDLMYVSGINADGTQKLNHDIVLGEHSGYTPYPLIGSDGGGGCYVSYYISREYPLYFMYHILSSGELASEEPLEVSTERFGHAMTAPTDDYSVYICNVSVGAVQRVEADGNLPWGLEGIDEPIGGDETSPPVITSDGGVLIVSENFAYRLTSEGNAFYRNRITRIDSIEGIVSRNALLIPSLDQREFTCIAGGITRRGGGWHSELAAFHFDSVAVNRWDRNGVMIDYRPGAHPYFQITDINDGIRLSDGSVVVSVNYQNGQFHPQTYLYKLYPDGTVAGRDTGVDNKNEFAQPKGFRLRSAFPNPFNGTVTLRVDLAYPGNYEWTVYSLTGQEVARNSLTTHHAGLFEQTWTPGESLASGVYLVRWMKEGQHLTTTKLVYLP